MLVCLSSIYAVPVRQSNTNRNVNINTNTNQDFNSIYESLFNQLTSNQNIGKEIPDIEAAVVDPSERAAEDVAEQDVAQENAEGKIYRPYRPRPKSSSSNYNSNYNQNNNFDYNSIFSSIFEQLTNQQTTNVEKAHEPTLNSEDE